MQVKVYSQVEKVLRTESKEVREEVYDILEKIVRGIPIGMPHVKSLASIGRGLYEIRVRDKAGQFRVMYIKQDLKIIYLIHAFRKKTEKIPDKEKRIILKRLSEITHEKNENL